MRGVMAPGILHPLVYRTLLSPFARRRELPGGPGYDWRLRRIGGASLRGAGILSGM